ncbi:MAG: hypothetical protein V4454_18845 [Pseudomonadota bacterium]
MSKTQSRLLNTLVYLDRAYIADRYEVATGTSPQTTISSAQGGKAGSGIPFLSAEVSAQETKTFSLSTLAMLSKTIENLEKEPTLNSENLKVGVASTFGWVTGRLSVFRATSTMSKAGKSEIVEESSHFSLKTDANLNFAFITTPEYFYSGFDTLLKIQRTVMKDMQWPVRAFVRVLPAQGHVAEWIAVPLIILEESKET